MLNVRVKRKIIIIKLDIIKPERFVPFDIKLPANVVRVKSVLITASKV